MTNLIWRTGSNSLRLILSQVSSLASVHCMLKFARCETLLRRLEAIIGFFSFRLEDTLAMQRNYAKHLQVNKENLLVRNRAITQQFFFLVWLRAPLQARWCLDANKELLHVSVVMTKRRKSEQTKSLIFFLGRVVQRKALSHCLRGWFQLCLTPAGPRSLWGVGTLAAT